MAKRPDKSAKIIAVAFKLARTQGWHGLSLSDIAAASKVPLPDLAQLFPTKSAIIAAWSRGLDAEVLKLAEAEDMEGEGARDRLFDVLMMRFDAMAADKPAVAVIARDLSRDPVAMIALLSPALQSLGWMLEAAGIDSSGLRGRLRVRGLAVIWARVFSIWLEDGEDQAKTMAELDRRLRQAEDLLKAVARFRNRAANGEVALSETINFTDFEKVDIRIGTVTKAEAFPEARKPAIKLHIDFGDAIGIKKSSAQITRHYSIETLVGRQVAAVVNFPPRQIGPFMSEVLTLGFEDSEGQVVLIGVDHQVPNGGKLM